jgi:type II secretory pathway component GspD/PulD (secretin)
MLSCRAALLFLIVAGTLFWAGVQPLDGAQEEPSGEKPRLTRVFELQGMDTREAVTLLRTHVQVRQIVELQDRDTVIVTEVFEKVDRSEKLLRELDAVARAVDPHGALSFARVPERQVETRQFRIYGIDSRLVVTVLRTIYQIRQVTELSDKGIVVVSAPLPVLDAAEALLSELGVLGDDPVPTEM